MSLSFIIYHIAISHAVWNIKTYGHMFISSYFQAKANEGRLSYVYPCVSLINHVFVICSITILHRFTQLCFTGVALDLGDSRK